MFFKKEDEIPGYIECPFDKRFLIYKDHKNKTYQLCVPNPDDYPSIIGWISLGDPGKIEDAHNLGWRINDEYRGQGLMSGLLDMFLQETTPDGSCFAVVVLKSNFSSLKLAQKVGFAIYDEDDEKFYLSKF